MLYKSVLLASLLLVFYSQGGVDAITCAGKPPIFSKVTGMRPKLTNFGDALNMGGDYPSSDTCAKACAAYTGWPCLAFGYSQRSKSCAMYKVVPPTVRLEPSDGVDFHQAYCEQTGVSPTGASTTTAASSLLVVSCGLFYKLLQ